MSDIKRIPEWEEKLGVLLRTYGNCSFDHGAYTYTRDKTRCYAEIEGNAADAKAKVVDYVRNLLEERKP